jgi:hypothetical protein
MTEKNNGIIVSGGTLNADVVAVGPGANAGKVVGVDSRTTVVARLDELLRALGSHDAGSPERAAAVTAASSLKVEVAKERPDHKKVSTFLAQLVAAASSISAVAGAVQGIQQAIAHLF